MLQQLTVIILTLTLTCNGHVSASHTSKTSQLLHVPKKTQLLQKQNTSQVGRFINILYKGEWHSSIENQNNFLKKNIGKILLAFAPTTGPDAKLLFAFELFGGPYVEDRYIVSDLELEVEEGSVGKLVGSVDNADVSRNNHIFHDAGSSLCDLKASLQLKDGNNNPLPLDTINIANIQVSGSIFSERCKIDFSFNVMPSSVDIIGALLFSLLQISAIVLGFYPLYKALKENDLSLIKNLSDSTFLANIAVDIILITINMTLAMQVLPTYFEFLTLISMFLMVSILFKVRFYMHIFELRIYTENVDIQTVSRHKFYFLLRFIVVSCVSIAFANFFLIYPFLFAIVFMYPMCQIYYNIFNVTRKNCYRTDLHLFMILPQIIYPVSLRGVGLTGGLFFRFLELKPCYNFSLVLFSVVFCQLGIMYLQKKVKPSFFVPRFLNIDFFEYSRDVKDGKAEGEDCPICFVKLEEVPEGQGGFVGKFLPATYMETPCGHRFHEGCLTTWMEQKLACPCCRTKIPPY